MTFHTGTCPSDFAWVNAPTADNTVHSNTVECSNNGLCDRSNGECECFDGWQGTACQRGAVLFVCVSVCVCAAHLQQSLPVVLTLSSSPPVQLMLTSASLTATPWAAACPCSCWLHKRDTYQPAAPPLGQATPCGMQTSRKLLAIAQPLLRSRWHVHFSPLTKYCVVLQPWVCV